MKQSQMALSFLQHTRAEWIKNAASIRDIRCVTEEQRKMMESTITKVNVCLSSVGFMRAEVGSQINLAELTTDEMMFKEIETRIAKLDEEIHNWQWRQGSLFANGCLILLLGLCGAMFCIVFLCLNFMS